MQESTKSVFHAHLVLRSLKHPIFENLIRPKWFFAKSCSLSLSILIDILDFIAILYGRMSPCFQEYIHVHTFRTQKTYLCDLRAFCWSHVQVEMFFFSQHEGIQGLFRGILPRLLRRAGMAALSWTLFDSLKQRLWSFLPSLYRSTPSGSVWDS